MIKALNFTKNLMFIPAVVLPFIVMFSALSIKFRITYKIDVIAAINVKFEEIANGSTLGISEVSPTPIPQITVVPVTKPKNPSPQPTPAPSPTPQPQPTPMPPPPPPNNPPKVFIKTPANAQTFYANYYDDAKGQYYAIVGFSGWGQDMEDGSVSPKLLQWYSRPVTGLKYYTFSTLIGTGSSFSRNFYMADCTNDNYTITLKGTDSAGAVGTTSIGITISCPVIY